MGVGVNAEQSRQAKPMLEHALEYLQLGYPVFPVCSPAMGQHRHRNESCKSAGKRPLIAWEAFQTRLPTINEVREWWTRWPAANIGMPTGRLSGVVVLDADSGDAKKLAMGEGGLDKTPAVFTGKPGGMHFWLAHPGEEVSNFASRRPGLDFRGDGGYVLVPPSLHASGANYRWVEATVGLAPAAVPGWLLSMLRGQGAEASAAEPGDALNLEIAVSGVPEGGRDDAMWRLACKLRNDGLERRYAEVIVRQAARSCSPPFDEAVALEKVERAWRTYQPEPTFTPGGSFSERATESLPVGGTYGIQSLADLLAMQIEGEPCLVEGLLWANRATWVFSDPNTGKTLLLLAMLLHVAAGRPFCGQPVKQGPVLVIEEDSPLTVAAEYVEMLADIYEFDLAALPFWINRSQGLRLVDGAGVQLAVDAINACPERPVAVLFDACERLVPSDRFTTKELDPLTRLFQWAIGEGITPVMIDHTNKDRPKKGEGPLKPMDKLYGARAKSAVSDVMLHVSGSLREGGAQCSVVKFRGEFPPSFSVTFDAVDGFTLRRERLQARSPSEQAVMRFFNNSASDWYGRAEIEAAVSMNRRTLQRTLAVLAKRGWLATEGEDLQRRYRISPNTAGVFG